MTESSKRDDLQSKFLKYKKTGEEKDVVLKFFLHEFPREEIYGQRRERLHLFLVLRWLLCVFYFAYDLIYIEGHRSVFQHKEWDSNATLFLYCIKHWIGITDF